MSMQIRLSQKEIKIIKEIIYKVFGKSEIKIFGSRINLSKKGGDVDIFVIPKNRDDLYNKKIKAKILLEEKLWRNVDIIIHKNFDYEIEREATKGVKINS